MDVVQKFINIEKTFNDYNNMNQATEDAQKAITEVQTNIMDILINIAEEDQVEREQVEGEINPEADQKQELRYRFTHLYKLIQGEGVEGVDAKEQIINEIDAIGQILKPKRPST